MYHLLHFFFLNTFLEKTVTFFSKKPLYSLYFFCNKYEEAYTSLFTVLFTATAIDLFGILGNDHVLEIAILVHRTMG